MRSEVHVRLRYSRRRGLDTFEHIVFRRCYSNTVPLAAAVEEVPTDPLNHAIGARFLEVEAAPF